MYLIQNEQRQRALELEKARFFLSVEKFQNGSHKVIETDNQVCKLPKQKNSDECGLKTEVLVSILFRFHFLHKPGAYVK